MKTSRMLTARQWRAVLTLKQALLEFGGETEALVKEARGLRARLRDAEAEIESMRSSLDEMRRAARETRVRVQAAREHGVAEGIMQERRRVEREARNAEPLATPADVDAVLDAVLAPKKTKRRVGKGVGRARKGSGKKR